MVGETVNIANTDSPYNVRAEPRSNNATAATLFSFRSFHHQSFDLNRGVSKPKSTTNELRPKHRILANDFIKDADYDVLLRPWFSSLAAVLEPGRALYICSGYANCTNYPSTLAQCDLPYQAVTVGKEVKTISLPSISPSFCFTAWYCSLLSSTRTGL